MKKIVILLLSITFFGCAEEDESIYTEISVNTPHKTLIFGGQFTIKSISDLPIEYQSENNYHASVVSVDQWGNAIIKAGYVGETSIKIFNGETRAEVKLNISPQINLYPTPPIDYSGKTKEEIIMLLGTPDEETENSSKYLNYSEESPYITYFFNQNNLLNNILVSVKNIYPFPLAGHLEERYRLNGRFNDVVVGNGLIYYNSLKDISPTLIIYLYGLDQEHDAVLYHNYSSLEAETNSRTFSLIY